MDPSTTILVTPEERSAFVVTVRAARITEHRVILRPEYLKKLGLEKFSGEDVVREAFVFLLEREPSTSVLALFSLDAIEDYFPEFRREIRLRMSG